MDLQNERRSITVNFVFVAMGLLQLVAGVGAIDPGASAVPMSPVVPTAAMRPTRSPSFQSRKPTSGNPISTDQPVAFETLSPSELTFLPTTPRPTESPTWEPSPAPSLMPSFSPVSPSRKPTIRATTSSPILSPTLPWTFEPTIGPSRETTLEPTSEPSFVTLIPTRAPSPLIISPEPTKRHSAAPTSEPIEYQDLINVVMYMENVQTLDSSSEITFQRITGDFIASEFSSMVDLNVTNLSVGTDVLSQEEVASLPTSSRRRNRKLAESLPWSKIFFNTKVSFQSTVSNINVAKIITGAFSTEEDRSRYIDQLKSSGDGAFSNVNSIKVVVDGKDEDNAAIIPPSDVMSTNTLIIIIGSAVGGTCLLVLATFLYCRMSGKQKPVTPTSGFHYSGRTGERVGADIVMDNQDDISTLGDPMYAPGGMMMGGGLDRDETVATSIVSGDWDYARNYGVASGPGSRTRSDTLQSSQNGSYADLSSFGGMTKMDNSILSDDMSFEQQFVEVEERFEVDAPSGKLGMVIDTPSGGIPIVHAIKASSILADRVEVGDRLISVDDEDTTGLTAMQVSKLISQKADNPSRILVFARTRARAMSVNGLSQ